MDINFDEVALAVAVNVEILREVLKKLSVTGRAFWIACEPAFAFERGYLTVGFGCPRCTDRLNTVLYRLPILNREQPLGDPDKLVVLIDQAVVVAEQPGLYRNGSGVELDELADLEDFLFPIRRALVGVLAEYTGASTR
jgi:hypothetical protein